MTSIGIPVKLVHEAVGHIVTIEVKAGTIYRGRLIDAEDNMNCQMREVTATAKEGRVTQCELVYIRGSHVRLVIVPDMLKNAPMFKRVHDAASRVRAAAMNRGRGASRARGRGRGGPPRI